MKFRERDNNKSSISLKGFNRLDWFLLLVDLIIKIIFRNQLRALISHHCIISQVY